MHLSARPNFLEFGQAPPLLRFTPRAQQVIAGHAASGCQSSGLACRHSSWWPVSCKPHRSLWSLIQPVCVRRCSLSCTTAHALNASPTAAQWSLSGPPWRPWTRRGWQLAQQLPCRLGLCWMGKSSHAHQHAAGSCRGYRVAPSGSWDCVCKEGGTLHAAVSCRGICCA